MPAAAAPNGAPRDPDDENPRADEGPSTASRQRGKPYQSRCLADIEARPLNWLWADRIALGKLNLIAGHPGRGKSQLTLSMAALVSTGGEWPDGSVCKRGSAVLISCEDEAADTIKPRLIALGADMSRCHMFDGVRDKVGKVTPFTVKRAVESLSAMAEDLGDLRLVIIDPISAYLDGLDSHNNAEVRGGLVPLQELAEKTGAAVLLVSHFNKGTADSTALSRISGSGAFGAVCRSAWLVERHPDSTDGSFRVFVPMKNNIGNDQAGFQFVVEEAIVEGNIKTSRIQFLPGEVHLSADELVKGCGDANRPPSQLNLAANFLSELLANGPMLQADVVKQAELQGIAGRTLTRAKREAGVRSKKSGPYGEWCWSIERPSKERQRRQDSQLDIEDWGGSLGAADPSPQEEGQTSSNNGNGHLGNIGNLGSDEAVIR